MIFNFFKQKRENQEIINNNDINEFNFVVKQAEKGITLHSSLMEYAAIQKGLVVKRINRRIILVKDSQNNEYGFVNMNGSLSSLLGKRICDRKPDAREILERNNIPVAKSKVFNSKNFKEALQYAKKIGFPVVVKPTTLSRGRGITTNIKSPEEFSDAWNKGINAYNKNRRKKEIIIEKHVMGEDYRFFVVNNKVVSVTQRKKAHVIGDGVSSIEQLINKKNELRLKNPYLRNYLIPLEDSKLDVLIREGLSLSTIPKSGEEIVLRSQSNLSAGGDSIDFTSRVHKDYVKEAIKSVNLIPGIKYAGVDFIAEDITKKPKNKNYIIGEIEFSPAPISHFPFKGERQDMASSIIELYIKNG